MAITSLPSLFSQLREHPNVRPIDYWRDGQSVASLLEVCFASDGIDDGGHRLIHILRNYGLTQSWMMQGSLGFVWVEDGQILGNASIQKNMLRKDTWMIGNVATRPEYRGRGIATAVAGACVELAQRKRAKHVALQVVAHNEPALKVYERLGFRSVGTVAHYRRASVRSFPFDGSTLSDMPHQPIAVRKAKWSDAKAAWQLAQTNTPESLTYAEPYDASIYKLGFLGWLTNSFSGNPEQWWVAENTAGVVGAVRTRVNYEGSEHHLELMLNGDTDLSAALQLLEMGLERFEMYLSKPIYAAQNCAGNPSTHNALQLLGFQPTRNLVHMRLDL